jgi:phosphatidylglycerophosphate synthase
MRKGWNKESALNTREILLKPLNRALQPLVKIIYKHTIILPNHLTITNAVVGLASLFFMAIAGHFPGFLNLSEYGLRLVGALLTVVYISLDSMDGQLARGGNLKSELGHWLDSTLDSVMFPFFLLSIAIGMNSYLALLVGGIAALCFPLQFLLQFKFKLESQNRLKDSPLATKSRLRYLYGGAVFFWLNIIFALINRPFYTLVFFATFGNLFWMGIAFFQYHAVRLK